MDWNLAIERNRAALGRIVAMLVAMAGLASLTSPLAGEDGSARRGDLSAEAQRAKADESTEAWKAKVEAEALAEPGEGAPVPTLPRHLHRAILRLLRPAESAVRRLVIVMARGLVVTLAPPRPRKPAPAPTFLKKPGGTGILMPPGLISGARPAPRTLALPLLDPLRPFHPRPKRPAQSSIPRISFPGVTTPSPIVPRRPPEPDDPLDATRLALRLQALGAALDDLPGQARRFARWRVARDAVGAQNRETRDAAGAQNKNQQTGRARRVWPLRPGRPPGQRPANRRTHEVFEILNDLHGLAFDVLECPDTS